VAQAEQSLPAVHQGGATWQRLEEQIRWYDDHSAANQRRYKACKYAEILAAAAIPACAAIGTATWVPAVLGALILLLEGIQHLNQYHQNWIGYRSTAEALKHEKYLFVAHAAQYSGEDPMQLLAIRVEGLVSQENATWVSTQREPGQNTHGTSRGGE
jgi:hypothetical protein